ncbi:hypothetical protein ACB092_02G060300 [Castanea dentata]
MIIDKVKLLLKSLLCIMYVGKMPSQYQSTELFYTQKESEWIHSIFRTPKKMLFISPGYHHPRSIRGYLCTMFPSHGSRKFHSCNLESKHDALAGTFPLLEVIY